MKTWQRYCFSHLFKMTGLCLLTVYLLYVFFDYSTHMREFSTGISFDLVVQYYSWQLLKHLHILLPLALLLATIKVLTSLNHTFELVALQAGGLSLKKLMLPFLITASASSMFLYINNEYLLPKAAVAIDAFEDLYFTKEHRFQPLLTRLPLSDGTDLYYQRFFQSTMALFDVYWVKNMDHLYRIKSLSLTPSGPIGYHVDELKRENGQMKLIASHDNLSLPLLRIETLAKTRFLSSFEAKSIAELNKHLHSDEPYYIAKKKTIQTHLFYKTLFPLTTLTIIFALFPLCTRFSRQLHTFKIYALSLFGFITYFAILGASVIIGKATSPHLAILIPTLTPFITFGVRTLCS